MAVPSNLRRLGSIAIAVIALGAVPPVPAAAAPAVTFDVTIGDSCFEGTVRPAGATIYLRLDTPGGQHRAFDKSYAGPDGTYGACFQGGGGDILGGNVIVAKIGGAVVRRWTVPAVHPKVDRAADVVTGFAKPGTSVDVAVLAGREDRRSPRNLADMTVIASDNGRFTADFAGKLDIRPSDEVMMTLASGRDRVTQQADAFFLSTSRGSPTVGGYAVGSVPFEVRLLGPGGGVRSVAHAFASELAYQWGAVFADAQGQFVYPRPGDRIVVPDIPDASLLLPVGALAGDPAADTVTGHCMANARYRLTISAHHPGAHFYLQLRGTTDEQGGLRRQIAPAGDLGSGDYLELSCLFPSGDEYHLSGQVH